MTDAPQVKRSFVVVRGEAPDDPALNGAVVAIGNFDGVHRGHRAVIAAARARANALGRPAGALTFEPHPRSFFRPSEPQIGGGIAELAAALVAVQHFTGHEPGIAEQLVGIGDVASSERRADRPGAHRPPRVLVARHHVDGKA